MCWKVEYILLIMASTLVDYLCGIAISRQSRKVTRRFFLILSITVNLGILFFFKYFDFFSNSLVFMFNRFNIFYQSPGFDFLLPVGISFYTFQTLSYTIDVYRGKKEPEKHLGIFALYVSFFPQLVAGPIERSTNLIKQFYVKHNPSYENFSQGLKQLLIGFIKKIVIANHLAIYVDHVFKSDLNYSGPVFYLALFFFSFQVYCDFSGYSDIAIGSAKMMGFDLMKNFDMPFFTKSVPEFWSKWHISLTTWFRDYLYEPLSKNKRSVLLLQLNIIIVFTLSGLWHGANWTFILWGLLHGLFYLLYHFLKKTDFIKLPSLLQVMISFLLINASWILFRADSISDSWIILKSLLEFKSYKLSEMQNMDLYNFDLEFAFFSILLLLLLEFIHLKVNLVNFVSSLPFVIKWSLYSITIVLQKVLLKQ
jgi:alginate O-acetyltransferase complex protein AlgI